MWLFISDSWEDRWVESKHKSDLGKFKLTAGKFYGDAEKDKGMYFHSIIQYTCTPCTAAHVSTLLHFLLNSTGILTNTKMVHCSLFAFYFSLGIQTSEDAKFYALSASFDKFSNDGKDLVVQFSVKHEQNIDCGGGYVKVFPSSLDQTDMHGESPYNIMFGMY